LKNAVIQSVAHPSIIFTPPSHSHHTTAFPPSTIASLLPVTSFPEQLTSVRRLLKKLQFMFELPSRMRRAIALDALAEAVQ
jgi:hypothetical protein